MDSRYAGLTGNTVTTGHVVTACLFCVLLLLLVAVPGNATEEYAETTGAECGACHLDSLGGGGLTDMGRGFLLSLEPRTVQDTAPKGISNRIIKLGAGYLHIVTAFMWFGTILYVHLVLKPSYASQGLPQGEVKVGMVSMVIMAVTGGILTYYRVPSAGLLISSQFGVLLLAKIAIFTVMVLSALFVVFVIGPKLKRKKIVEPGPSGELTPDELAGFDGAEGRPAYFAFNGRIYDASGSRLWKNGNHMKRHQAGVDLTDVLSLAPHDEDKVLALPEIGRLAGESEAASSWGRPKKVFYFMAYMNLGFVFIISLILALWRWY